MPSKISSEYVYFIFSRMIALLVKPLFLWFLLNKEFSDAANVISLFYLTISSVMVVFNNEAHFDFYKSLFESKQRDLRDLFNQKKNYYERFAYHIAIFSSITFILTYILSKNIVYAISFFLILILEKFFDEIQRLLQFKKRFKEWSNIFMLKSITPLVFAVAAFYIFGKETILIGVYLSFYFLITLYIILYKTTSNDKKLFIKVLNDLNFKKIINYLKIYKQKLFLNQLQSFSTRNIPLTDRLVVQFFIPDFLAQISIISQLGTVCIMFVDYFLIAHRRREYIAVRKSIFEIVSLTKLMFFFIVSFISYILLIATGIYFKLLQEIDLSFLLLLMIGLYYSIFAISQHFAQFNFWNLKRKYTLSVDLIFYLVVFSVFLFLRRIADFYFSLAITLLVAHICRLVMSTIISIKKKNK